MPDHYIKLSHQQWNDRYGQFIRPEIEEVPESSWVITYIDKEKYYLCQKSQNKKIKMQKVESFIRTWAHDTQYKLGDPARSTKLCGAEIAIYIGNEYYSGHKCAHGSLVPDDVIQTYISLLTDIIHDNHDQYKAEETVIYASF